MIKQVFRLITRFSGTWWAWNFYVVCLHVIVVLAALGIIGVLCRRAHPSVRAAIWSIAPIGLAAVTYLCFSRMAWIAWILPWKLATPLVALTASGVRGQTLSGAALTGAPDWRWIVVTHALWICGCLLVLGRVVWSWSAAARATSRRARVSDTALLLRLRRARATAGVWRRVVLRWGADGDIPTVLGVIRPTIVVPRGLLLLTPAQQDAVLLHELAHVRRHDVAAQAAMYLVCAWYWFLPVVWWAAEAQRTSREEACDALVLRSGIRPSEYASSLMALAGSRDDSAPSLQPGVALARPRRLVKRLRIILSPSAPARSAGGTVVAVVVSVVLIVIAVGSARLVPTRAALWASYSSDDEATRAAAAVLLTAEPDSATRVKLAASARTEPSAFVRRILTGR